MQIMTTPRHTDIDIEQAAQRFERIADTLDPATAQVERADGLCAITAATEGSINPLRT
jgi:hypothetical protein